jgi:hypothetical protein
MYTTSSFELYLLFALPGLLLGLWAQYSLRSTFARYAQVPTATGVTGQQAAELLIRDLGLQIGVQGTPGMLTDFYDPGGKTINLSQSSVQGSVASVAVVAHELGHAVQDAQNYTPMRLRGAIVPAVQTGAWVGPLMFIGGLAFNNESLAFVGLIAFSLGALFALVTLPVEFDASRRALVMLQQYNVLEPAELPAAQRVLRAAALTYVAAALQSLGTVLYYATMLMGRRSDD